MRRRKYANRGIAFLPALAIFTVVAGGLGLLVWWGLKSGFAQELLFQALVGFLGLLVTIAGHLFYMFGNLAAYFINSFAIANPFSTAAFAPTIWETFKNIAYVILVFMALYVGILYIVQREEQTKRLVFMIILVALSINFSFFIAKEIFLIFHTITVSLACLYGPGTANDCNSVGTAIFTSLAPLDVNGNHKTIMEELFKNTDLNNESDLIWRFSSGLMTLVLFFVWTALMFIFAGIFIGRFIMIALLTGLLPLALVSLATPWHKNQWDDWWKSFLKWSAMPVILLLLILIGFGLIIQAFIPNTNNYDFVNLVEQGNDNRISATVAGGGGGGDLSGLITMFRFVFVVLYYAYVIHLAVGWSGSFGNFGFNAAKWAYISLLGGAVAAGGREAFNRTLRSPLSGGLKKVGNKLLGSRSETLQRIGERISSFGETLSEPVKERREKLAKARVKAFEDKPDRLRQMIIEDKTGQMAKVVAEDLGKEKFLSLIRDFTPEQINQFRDNKAAIAQLAKITGALRSAIEDKNTSLAAEELVKLPAGIGVAGLNRVLELLGEKDINRRKETLQKAFLIKENHDWMITLGTKHFDEHEQNFFSGNDNDDIRESLERNRRYRLGKRVALRLQPPEIQRQEEERTRREREQRQREEEQRKQQEEHRRQEEINQKIDELNKKIETAEKELEEKKKELKDLLDKDHTLSSREVLDIDEEIRNLEAEINNLLRKKTELG
jgi:hypothetical protein